MKLSKASMAILKNYASINGNILFKEGMRLSTISAQKNIFSSVTLPEEFDTEFGIYDLSEFLGALSLFGDPELEFSEKSVKIYEGSHSIKYFAADVNVLTIPTKEIKFPPSDVDFTLTASNLDLIRKTASVLHGSDIAITGNGTTLSVVVSDKKNATSNQSIIEIGQTDKTFRILLKVENLKLLPGDYEVSLSVKKISRFKSTTTDMEYFIAIESDSSFE